MNQIVKNYLSCIQDYTNPTLVQFIFMRLVQHLQMSWTSVSKTRFTQFKGRFSPGNQNL